MQARGVPTDLVADVDMFGDAHHELCVVGSAEEGYRLWCRRCDRRGAHVHRDLETAHRVVATCRKDIAPRCFPSPRPLRSA